MNLKYLILILILVVLLINILTPAFAGIGIIGLVAGGEYTDDDNFSDLAYLPISWLGGQIYQLSILFNLGLSIFALFAVYSGGRSNNKRFHDRILELINFLFIVFSKTAPHRAVFVFYYLILA